MTQASLLSVHKRRSQTVPNGPPTFSLIHRFVSCSFLTASTLTLLFRLYTPLTLPRAAWQTGHHRQGYTTRRESIMTTEKDSVHERRKEQEEDAQMQIQTEKPSSHSTSTHHSANHVREKDPTRSSDHRSISSSSSSSPSTTVEAICATDDPEATGSIANANTNANTTNEESKPIVVMVAPPDGGYGWVVVGACFLNNFSMLGIMFSWGIFQQLYTTEVFPGQVSAVSWIGTLAFGCMYIIGGIFSLFAARIGYRKMILTGSLFVAGGCIAASFATQVRKRTPFFSRTTNTPISGELGDISDLTSHTLSNH